MNGEGIGPALSARLIETAAAHGPERCRALAQPWGVSVAAIDRFCRENETAIRRARLARSKAGS